jgi:hypothetical protein
MTSRRIVAGVVFGIAGVCSGAAGVAAGQLSAQVERAEPYKVVVLNEQAMVRCGPGAAYYPVGAALRPGTILTADGETAEGWLRVRYPADGAAFVRAEHVDLRSDTQTAVLTREDGLVAFNAATGARGSWSKLLAEPLPAGTELSVIAEAMNDLTGQLAGYRVEPPDGARGFIRAGDTRRATAADIEAAPDDDAIAVSSPEVRVVSPTVPVTTPDANQAEQAERPAADSSASEPAVTQAPSPAPGASPAATPATTQEPSPSAQPASTAGEGRPIRTFEELEEAFAAVQAQPMEEAEFDQLLSEADRMIAATPATAENTGLLAGLESRRSVLQIRKRVQQVYRDNLAASRQADDTAHQISERVQQIKIAQGFSAVGRLLPSAVYDGRRLPRLYRVQSIDRTEAPRTLGYLRADPAFDLESKLNQTVGVVGALRDDPRLNVQIIEPIRVDLIQVTPEG